MEVIIDVKNLTKNFNGLLAVNDLSFTVNKGDVYGFLGQNGAGKSTTMRMLLSLIEPSAGSIDIFGESLLRQREKILTKTGAIIERPDLYKYLTAIENLEIFAKMSGLKVRKNFLVEKLSYVGLADRADSKIKTFSQGMKQRLGLAVALVHDPELIILDEPTNGLDPQGIAEVRELIVSLSRDHGKTVIISSHLLYEIEQIASRMLIINKGIKIAEGDVDQLLDPSNTTVILETSDNASAIAFIKSGLVTTIKLLPHSIRLEMNRNNIPELIRVLISNGVDVYSVQSKNKLEDYFLNLTNQDTDVDPASN